MLANLRVPTKILKKVITKTALILIDGDVVRTYLNPDVEFDAEASDENISAVWEDVKDQTIFHLFVPNPTTHITLDVTKYAHAEFDGIKRAEALVIKSLAHRLLAKFYMNRRGSIPVRVFDSESKAIEWFELIRAKEGY